MPIQISWLDSQEKRILLKAEGGWTWDDYHKAMADMYAMMNQSPHDEIDFVLDLSRSSLFPTDMLNKMKRKENHPKSHKMVVLGAGALAQTLFNLMRQLAHERMKNIKLCKTIEEANAFFDEA